MMAAADLHIHSWYSDGELSPEAIVERAKSLGLRCISITDHDSVEGVSAALRRGAELGLEVIPGVELSTIFHGRDVHILGYFVDIHDRVLLDYLQLFRDKRHGRAERMVRKLNALGVPIKIEMVLEKSRFGCIGRPHVATVMVDQGFVSSVDEAFARYIGYDRPAYEDKYQISPADAIQIIDLAGGISVLAHPGTYFRYQIIADLAKWGLSGIEVVHPKHAPELVLHYERIAEEYGLLKTGGSDCHRDMEPESALDMLRIPYSYVEDMKVFNRSLGAGIRG